MGRASSADVQLTDAKASREHCRFAGDARPRRPSRTWVARTAPSSTGRLIQARTALAAGDEIAVGDSLFVLDPIWTCWRPATARPPLCLAPSSARAGAIRGPQRRRSRTAPDALAGALGGAGAARWRAAAERRGGRRGRCWRRWWRRSRPTGRSCWPTTAAAGIRPLCGHSRAAVVAISRTVLELVRRERRALLLDDAVSDRELQKARSVLRHGLRSVMVAPVLAGARAARVPAPGSRRRRRSTGRAISSC